MDNDFRSLELGSPLRGWDGVVYRKLSWSGFLLRGGVSILSGDHSFGENDFEWFGHVIRNPLKINGGTFSRPGGFFFAWDLRGDRFMGVRTFADTPLSQADIRALTEYAERKMNLHSYKGMRWSEW